MREWSKKGSWCGDNLWKKLRLSFNELFLQELSGRKCMKVSEGWKATKKIERWGFSSVFQRLKVGNFYEWKWPRFRITLFLPTLNTAPTFVSNLVDSLDTTTLCVGYHSHSLFTIVPRKQSEGWRQSWGKGNIYVGWGREKNREKEWGRERETERERRRR